MKQLPFFSSVILLACIALACTGNSSTANSKDDKQNSTSDPVSGSTGGSGKDIFYEYKLTTSGKNMSIQTDTKIYISSKGDMRVEMDVTNSANHGSSGPIIIIAHSGTPDESISIDDSAKTYSYNRFSDSDLASNEKMKTISVTKVGEEKILGYNSVQARIITEKSIGSFYSSVDTLDLWRSDDVPFLSSVKALFQKFEAKTGNAMYSSGVVNQLKQMGCDGFMTKMEIHSERSSTKEELVKVEHRDLSANLFQIPAGYKQSKNDM